MNQNNDYQNLYQSGEEPPKQKHTGCIIAFVVVLVLFLILAVLAAILVPAMIGYVRKSRTAKTADAARQCYKAASNALYDLKETDDLKNSTYIITNIPGESDFNAPFDTKALHEAVSSDFADGANGRYTYFFVVEGDEVTYTAVRDEEHLDYICTYPRQAGQPEHSVTAYDGTEIEIPSNYWNTGENPFLELFWNARNTITALPGQNEEE